MKFARLWSAETNLRGPMAHKLDDSIKRVRKISLDENNFFWKYEKKMSIFFAILNWM